MGVEEGKHTQGKKRKGKHDKQAPKQGTTGRSGAWESSGCAGLVAVSFPVAWVSSCCGA